MNVSHTRTSLWVFLTFELAWGAQHHGRNWVLQSWRIRFSRFLRIRGWEHPGTGDRAKFCSTKVWGKALGRQIACDMVCQTFTIATVNCWWSNYSNRYCVPMDNQRPELDLRFFDDICPDKNSKLSLAYLTYLTSISSPRHCSIHQIWPIPS